ncbi:MAG: hypothetical protein U1E03_11385 [Hyphomonadaceae bacterium]
MLIDGPAAQPPAKPSADNGGYPEREECVACLSHLLPARFGFGATIDQPIFPVSKQMVGVNEEARPDGGD